MKLNETLSQGAREAFFWGDFDDIRMSSPTTFQSFIPICKDFDNLSDRSGFWDWLSVSLARALL
jgi:hypothetical protein